MQNEKKILAFANQFGKAVGHVTPTVHRQVSFKGSNWLVLSKVIVLSVSEIFKYGVCGDSVVLQETI